MSDDVGTFEPFEDSSEYSIGGGNFGSPIANALFNVAVGQNYRPRPQGAQSMYDSLIQRERSKSFMKLQGSAFSNSEVFKRMGMGGSAMGGMIGSLAGSPNGMMAKMMSPVLGGNPMAAAMQTYAGFSGANVMGNFGRKTAINERETEGVMQSLAKNFYQERPYEGAGGGKEKYQQETSKFIKDRVKQGPAGMAYMKSIAPGLDLKTDASGSLTEESNQKVEQFSKDITDENSKTAKDLRNRIANKKVSSGDMLNELDKVLREEDGKKQEALKNVLVTRLKKEGVGTEAEIKSFEDKPSKGAANIRGAIEGLADPSKDFLEKTYLKAQGEKEAGGSYQGFQFKNTRGFKLEDFTSGLYKASELRMLGDRRGQSVEGAMGDFSKHAGGAMSAARSLFGKDKSGGELVEAMSGLVGSSDVNLGDEKGAGQMEDLLRKVKSTARVAGISIKTMLGIVNSAKELAANNPALQHMNSAATTHMAMSAVTKAADIGTAVSGKDYRAMGASQGISSRDIVETQQYIQSNLGGGLGALLVSAKGNKDKGAFGKLQELVESGAVTGSYLEDGGFGKIAKLLGKSEEDVRRTFMSDAMKKEAVKDKETTISLEKASNASVTESFFTGYAANTGKDRKQLEQDYREHMENGGTTDQYVASLSVGLGATGERMIAQYGGKIGQHFINSNRPPGQKEEMQKMIDRQAADEKKVAAEMDQYNAPAITTMIDSIAKADKIDVNSVSEALATTFATKKTNTVGTNEALDNSRAAGADIAEMVSQGKGQNEMIKAGIGRKLTTLVQGMRGQAWENKDTAAAGRMSPLNERYSEENSELKEFAKSDTLKGVSMEKAKEDLSKLRTKKEAIAKKEGKELSEVSLGAAEERKLQGLEKLQKRGALDDTDAYNTLKKGTEEEADDTLDDLGLKAGLKVAKTIGGSAKGAKEMLKDLREQEADLAKKGGHLDAGSQERKRGLEYLESKGILEHESSYKLVQSGKVEAAAAAVLESRRATLVEEKTGELKKGYVKTMGENLAVAAKSTNAAGKLEDKAVVAQDLLKSYSQYEEKDASGQGTGKLTLKGYEKVLADYEKPEKGSFFADEQNKKRFNDAGLGGILTKAQESITNANQSALASSGGAPAAADPNKPLIDQIGLLITEISKGGGIATALGELGTAILGIK